MMKCRIIRSLLLAIATSFLIFACNQVSHTPPENLSQSPTTATNCRLIEHQMGETQICGRPQRIVALGPAMLELLLALDVQPVGYAEHVAFYKGDYDNPSKQIPYLGDRVTTEPVNVGLDNSPSTEKLLKANPDLILATQINKAQYKTLSNIAPTLVFQWDNVETNLRATAQAVKGTDYAEQLLAEVEKRIETARQTFTPVVTSYPKVAILASVEARQFNLVTHKNSVCGSLVNELGFQLVYPSQVSDATLDNDPLPLSLETLPQLNDADSVILLGYNFDSNQQAKDYSQGQLKNLEQGWKENAIAQSLQASKAGRIYFVPAYLCFGLPGPIGTELYLETLKEQLLRSN